MVSLSLLVGVASVHCRLLHTEPILTNLVDDYRKDTEGHNVVQCVHVEAVWPGDPVGETA